MKLVRTRPCDGKCCEESPRFPNEDKTNCIFRDETGCKLFRDKTLIPEGYEDWIIQTCFQWPQFYPAGRGTGGCCWQWVDG